jgi:acyl-CoA thioesterase-2
VIGWQDAPVTATPLQQLVDILDLEPIEVNIFRGRSPDVSLQRVFGGQVAGQALVAAGRTVPADRPVHSLHAYFLRGGDPAVPIVYEVDRVRDGRSFTTRRVVAVQHGMPIFHLAASFQLPADGVEHQVAMPAAVDPETLPTFRERYAPYAEEMGEWYSRPRPIDLRYVEDPPRVAREKGPRSPNQLVWMRADGTLPDDPLLHVCALTYASDMTLLESVLLGHGLSFGMPNLKGASLDHAMWFHRPFRADEWMLYDQESPSASGARGFARGRLYSRDGRLCVSVAQEGMLRIVR